MKLRIPEITVAALLSMMLTACGEPDPPNDPEPATDNTHMTDTPVTDTPVTDTPDRETPAETNTGPEEVSPESGPSSEVSRETEPRIDDAAFESFASDNREFAFALFRQLRENQPDENIFLSPHSIATALAMVYGGAQGATREQMAEVLRFRLEGEELDSAFNRLDHILASRAEYEPEQAGDAFELDIINQTWGQESFAFRQEYLDQLARHYGASVELVDFIRNFESIREDINRWVEEQTNDRIEDLLPSDSVTADTRFILVNAIYFLGSWHNPFEADDTSEESFTTLDGSQQDVPFMRQTTHFPFVEGNDTIALSMPYVGEDVSLIAFMPSSPDADFRAWEDSMTRETLDQLIDSMRSTRVQVHFPKFETESSFGLSKQLEAMGMIDAFDECAADFGGITGSPPCIPDESLYIDEVFHKTFVAIDEEGTEAAAATAVVMMRTTSLPADPREVRFDRPFHYAIYDHPTDTILFLGRLTAPEP